MTNEQKQPTAAPATPATPATREQRPRRGGPGAGKGGPRRGGRPDREPREFDQKTLDLARVTRVTAGGKRMSFRATVVIGDKKGRVGVGTAKGNDVQLALEKSYRQAKKHMIRVPLKDETIPHAVLKKYASAEVLLKPAPRGTGLKAGGAVRVVLELAGVPNAVSKVIRSSNKINIARATLAAIGDLKIPAAKKE
jgi:small subunit ribosomal protein S5